MQAMLLLPVQCSKLQCDVSYGNAAADRHQSPSSEQKEANIWCSSAMHQAKKSTRTNLYTTP